jgi:hypothetical protein
MSTIGDVIVWTGLSRQGNDMQSRSIIGFVLAVLFLPMLASAQTDTSLRIRSIGSTFEGLIDDYLTDVHLNPARTAELDSSMVYAGLLPSRSVAIPFPVARWFYWSGNVVENQYIDYTMRPIGLSWFGGLGDGLAWSLGTEIDVDSWEDATDQYDIDHWEETTYASMLNEARTSTVQHYLVDLTVASRHTPLGGRITVVYDGYDRGEAVVRDSRQARNDDLENTRSNYDYRFFQGELERFAVSASLGLSMPGRWARDLVIGGGFIEERLSADQQEIEIDDFDEDGNGEWYGNDIHYRYSADEYASTRDYTGYNVFARAHFDWSDRIRSVHAGGWSRSTGDGIGGLGLELRAFDDTEEITSDNQIEYRYDGTVDRYSLESSIGYSNAFFEGILFAFGLRVAWARTILDEPADGTIWGEDSETGTSYSAPYAQKHDNTADGLRLSVPAGIEWQLHKYVALRLGATFSAHRSETDRNLTGEVSELPDGESLFILGGLNSQRHRIDSDVDVVYSSGLEFNINDRFVLDLLGTYSSSIYLSEYGYVSARFLF